MLANSPAASAAAAIEASTSVSLAGGLDLSVGHWVTDGLLAIFFFLAAIELKHELRHGELNTRAKALVPVRRRRRRGHRPRADLPASCARLPSSRSGWPIPTATDIAFALGVLAIVGQGLPADLRALLLALAVIDDLIAILIIAVFFTDDAAAVAPARCGSRRARSSAGSATEFGGATAGCRDCRAHRARRIARGCSCLSSGIHPTIAGVALGLIMAGSVRRRTRTRSSRGRTRSMLPALRARRGPRAHPDQRRTPS